jgi:hypothetical protein
MHYFEINAIGGLGFKAVPTVNITFPLAIMFAKCAPYLIHVPYYCK